MGGRGGNLLPLGVISMAVMMNVCFEEVYTVSCSDWAASKDNFTHAIPMCQTGTSRNYRMLIDTWESNGPDVHKCICIVTLSKGSAQSTTTITVEEYDGIEPLQSCGSILKITSTTSNSYFTHVCETIREKRFQNFGANDTLTMTLSRKNVSTQWQQSGHCIFISQNNTDLDIVVTCQNPQGSTGNHLTIPTSSSESVVTSTSTITTTFLTSTVLTTTTSSTEVTTTTTKTTSPTHHPSISPTVDLRTRSTTSGEQTLGGSNTADTKTEIIVGAACGGGLLLILLIIVIVIMIRRRRPNTQQFNQVYKSHGNPNCDVSDGIRSYVTTITNKQHIDEEEEEEEEEEEDTLTHNSLYVSTGPRDPGTNHIIAGTGDMYAQVQKPVKRSTVDATDTEKIELEETPQGLFMLSLTNQRNKTRTMRQMTLKIRTA